MDFYFDVAILIITSLAVGLCGYWAGCVHGFEKGRFVTEQTKPNFDELVFEYCPSCKSVEKAEILVDDAVLDSEEIYEF